jgi:hypothetical protein
MRIDQFQRIDKEGSALKASFNAVIPEWDFTLSMTYFRKNDGSSWFGYPSREYVNQAGEKKYKWLAFFGEKGKARFEKALKEELKKHLDISEPKEVDWNAQDIPF